MKNKADDLHNILFEQLERLNDENIKGQELADEIKRATALHNVAKQIIANGSLMLSTIKMADELGIESLPAMLTGEPVKAEIKLITSKK